MQREENSTSIRNNSKSITYILRDIEEDHINKARIGPHKEETLGTHQRTFGNKI